MVKEREKLSAALADKLSALEELKATQELLNRKVKARDRKVRELEEETLRVTEQLAQKVRGHIVSCLIWKVLLNLSRTV